MKLYVVVESGDFDFDGDKAVLGATRYKNDAIKYAAECNDNNAAINENRICHVQEFESEDINTESKIMPFIKYSIVFDANGKLLIVTDSSYTYNECFDIHYKKLSKCYIMSITLDYNVPESTAKEIAQNKMKDYLKKDT